MNPSIHCFPHGVTRLLILRRPFEIIQIPGRVLMLFERDHWVRQIWMDAQHPKDVEPSWLGHSVGRYDGDELVVDTIGFNDKTWLDNAGHVHSDALHVVERIRRVDHDTLRIDFAFDDPKAYKEPWTAQQVYKLHPDWQIREDVICEDHLGVWAR